MTSLMRRRPASDKGAEAVEFAIIVPVLLLLIFALIGFGLVFFAQISITQAAREGARYAAICQQDATCLSGVASRVQSRAPNITIKSSSITMDPTTGCPTGSAGNPVPSVTVTVSYDLQIPGLSLVTGSGDITLTSKASAPCGG